MSPARFRCATQLLMNWNTDLMLVHDVTSVLSFYIHVLASIQAQACKVQPNQLLQGGGLLTLMPAWGTRGLFVNEVMESNLRVFQLLHYTTNSNDRGLSMSC
jgi:hypothetical protein